MQQSLVQLWWAHPMARELPLLVASRHFHVAVHQVTSVRTKTTDWRWPPTEDRCSFCTDHSRNAAYHGAQLVRMVKPVPHPLWRSYWVLMWWDTKVVSLLHVYVPLTGNKVSYFLCFGFFFLTSQMDHPVYPNSRNEHSTRLSQYLHTHMIYAPYS
jgi:hypothetical protein